MPDDDVKEQMLSDLKEPWSSTAAMLTTAITDSFGDACAAVLHYGSQLHPAQSKRSGTHDFIVLLDDANRGFEHFVARRLPHFSASVAKLVSRVLPPSIVGVTLERERAKCLVLTRAQFAHACSPDARDHFIKGRVVQPIRLTWARTDDARATTTAALLDARASTLSWTRPSLPPEFDVATYCRCVLAVSYGAEIRLERNSRAHEVAEAHGVFMERLFQDRLESLETDGSLLRTESGFALRARVTRVERWRVRLYFTRSRLRAIARWPKSMLLYDRWLDYLREKAERRTGWTIELSRHERRWAFLLLWPKVLRVITSRGRS